MRRKNGHRGVSREGKNRWLILFYTVPSKPVAGRVKVWRRLAKAGAVQLKGSVYILPYSDESLELFQWLVSEVTAMGGEGAFVKADSIETMKEKEIVELFNRQREKDYRDIGKDVDECERIISSMTKGGGIQDRKKLLERLNRHIRDLEEKRKIDFFDSRAGNALKRRIDVLQYELKGLFRADVRPVPAVTSRARKDYQNRIWATRKRPFVDRMASAWLIRRFIDKNAAFRFIDERDISTLDKNTIAFDVRDGEFTHIGDMCTFEVLVRAFGIKDRTLNRIAEVVHELDMKDGKYVRAEAEGIETVLSGIRKTVADDAEALEKGMEIFEMMYVLRA